jgi:hypothetical protein
MNRAAGVGSFAAQHFSEGIAAPSVTASPAAASANRILFPLAMPVQTNGPAIWLAWGG